MDIEAVSGWGVPGDDGLAFGVASTLVEDANASMVYSRIGDGSDIWKMLSGRVIYLVYGSGSAAEG